MDDDDDDDDKLFFLFFFESPVLARQNENRLLKIFMHELQVYY